MKTSETTAPPRAPVFFLMAAAIALLRGPFVLGPVFREDIARKVRQVLGSDGR